MDIIFKFWQILGLWVISLSKIDVSEKNGSSGDRFLVKSGSLGGICKKKMGLFKIRGQNVGTWCALTYVCTPPFCKA